MKKTVYWVVLFNPIILAVYWYAWNSIWYTFDTIGMIRKFAFWGLVGISWLCIWTIIYHLLKKRMGIKARKWLLFIMVVEIITFAGLTGYYGYMNMLKLDARYGSTCDIEMKLKEDNLYKTGLGGTLESIDRKVDLPEQLYVSNEVEIEVESDGTITDFYACIYGKNEKGETKTYLISYRPKRSTMEIYLDGTMQTDFVAQDDLQPMKDMLDTFFKNGYIKKYIPHAGGLTFEYRGYEEKTMSNPCLIYQSKDQSFIELLVEREKVSGYFIDVYQDEEVVLSLISGLDSMKTKAEMLDTNQ